MNFKLITIAAASITFTSISPVSATPLVNQNNSRSQSESNASVDNANLNVNKVNVGVGVESNNRNNNLLIGGSNTAKGGNSEARATNINNAGDTSVKTGNVSTAATNINNAGDTSVKTGNVSNNQSLVGGSQSLVGGSQSLNLNYRDSVQFPTLPYVAAGNASVGSTSCPTAQISANVFGMGADGQGANYGATVGISAPIGGISDCRDAMKTEKRILEQELRALRIQVNYLQQTLPVVVNVK